MGRVSALPDSFALAGTHTRPYRIVDNTLAFQVGNESSILSRVTTKPEAQIHTYKVDRGTPEEFTRKIHTRAAARETGSQIHTCVSAPGEFTPKFTHANVPGRPEAFRLPFGRRRAGGAELLPIFLFVNSDGDGIVSGQASKVVGHVLCRYSGGVCSVNL